MATVNKRETSFEGLVSQLENGEDGIYNLINNSRQIKLTPKISITEHDLETIPCLRQLRDTINLWAQAQKEATGKDAYTIKKALIEMRKDQYLIKQSYQKPIVPNRLTHSGHFSISLIDESVMEEDGIITIKGFSLMDTKVVSAILDNYSRLKEDSYGDFEGDIWYLIEAFEKICDRALEPHPIYQRIIELKIDGLSNAQIHDTLQVEFGTTYSPEYLSDLWRNKFPKLIAKAAQEQYIEWYYKRYNLKMKKCSRCGQKKPSHNMFFSKNNTSKDSFYSICKKCRSKK